MELSEVGLAIIPPALAIAVERLSPISEALLRSSSEQDLRDYETANHQHLIDDATKLAHGAVKVSGLAPTLVASVTSGFAVLHEFPQPFWPAIIYVLIFIVLVLLLLRLLAGQTFVQLDDRRLAVTLWGQERILPWTRTKMISYFIYTANLILIAFATLTYFLLEKPWTHLAPK